MRKTVFKTFMYSFAISMLAIFSIGKLPSYFPKRESRNEQIKISGKNISLFVKKEEPKPTAVTLASVDREPLPEMQKEDEYDDEMEKLYAELDLDIDSETLNISEMDLAKSEEIDNIDLTEINIDETILVAENSAEENESGLSILSDEEFEARMKIAVLENLKLKKPEAEKEKTTVEELVVAQNEKTEEISTVPTAENEIEEIIVAENSNSLLPIQRSNNNKRDEKIQISTEASENQVAMAKSNAPVQSLMTDEGVEQTTVKDETLTSQWQSMTNKGIEEDNPWVVAETANKHPTNTMTLGNSLGNAKNEEKKATEKVLSVQPKNHSGEVKVAEMVRNILIPIPEDILKEDNLTPQLISSKRNKDLQEKIEQTMRDKKEKEEVVVEKPSDVEKIDESEEAGMDKKGKKTIFDSISSIFSGKTPVVGVSKVEESEYDLRNSVYVKKSKKTKKDYKVTKILPTEIKLSFQPNRAEISGQTLKWIEAFANKTQEDKTVVLEIRIDGTSSFELQQKRLSLLHNILTNKGVDYNKINTVFTTREPNSFIIRTVRINDKNVATTSSQRTEDESKNYLSW